MTETKKVEEREEIKEHLNSFLKYGGKVEKVEVPTGKGEQHNTYYVVEKKEKIVGGVATGPDFKQHYEFRGRQGANKALSHSHIHMYSEFGRDNPKKWTEHQRELLIPFFETTGDHFVDALAGLQYDTAAADKHIRYKAEQPLGTSPQMGTTRQQREGIMEALAYGKDKTIMVGSGVLDEIKAGRRRDISQSDRDVSSSRRAMPKQLNLLEERLGKKYPIANYLGSGHKHKGFEVKAGKEHLIGFHDIAGHSEVRGGPVQSIANKPVWAQTPGNFVETKMYRSFGSGDEAHSRASFDYNPHTRKTTAHLSGDPKTRNDLIDSRDMALFVARNARRTKHTKLAHQFMGIAHGFNEGIMELGKSKRKTRK